MDDEEMSKSEWVQAGAEEMKKELERHSPDHDIGSSREALEVAGEIAGEIRAAEEHIGVRVFPDDEPMEFEGGFEIEATPWMEAARRKARVEGEPDLSPSDFLMCSNARAKSSAPSAVLHPNVRCRTEPIEPSDGHFMRSPVGQRKFYKRMRERMDDIGQCAHCAEMLDLKTSEEAVEGHGKMYCSTECLNEAIHDG